MAYILGSAKYLFHDSKIYSYFFSGLAAYTDYFLAFIELIVFSNFYYQIVGNPKLKTSIVIANLIFTFYFIYKLFSDKKFPISISEKTQAEVYTVEATILLPICFFYFVEIFKKNPDLNLKNEPAFWLSTGLGFFLTCTLPYSFLENYFRKNNVDLLNTSYTIFYVFYIVMPLKIIKTILCKPKFR